MLMQQVEMLKEGARLALSVGVFVFSICPNAIGRDANTTAVAMCFPLDSLPVLPK